MSSFVWRRASNANTSSLPDRERETNMPADIVKCYPGVLMDDNNQEKLAFGFIREMKIGTTAVQPVQPIVNPANNNEKVKVVAIISHFAFENGKSEPIRIDGFCKAEIAE